MSQTFQNQARKMRFPRASLPTSKLVSKISGNIGPPDVSFSLYWLSRHPPGYLPLFLSFLSHVGIYVHTRLVAHISISISYTSSKLLCKYTLLFIHTGDCIKKSFNEMQTKKVLPKCQLWIPTCWAVASLVCVSNFSMSWQVEF